mgnify:CR=1 FL=1
MKFFRKRLQNNYGEDWAVIPNLDIVKEEEDSKSVAYLMLKDKLKDEKGEERKLSYTFRNLLLLQPCLSCRKTQT